MDVSELVRALELVGVPTELVALGEARDGAFSLVRLDNERWEVSWREQGRTTERHTAASEAAACLLLLGRLSGTWLAAVSAADGPALPSSKAWAAPAISTRRASASATARDRDRGRQSSSLQGILPSDYDPFGGLGERRWNRRYWPRRATDSRGRRILAWPDYDQHPEGFADPDRRDPIVLEPGALVDQFGSPFSRFAYPAETPFPHRGLPPDYLECAYRKYRVLRQIPVWSGKIAPAFGQPGGGYQYFLLEPTIDLISTGYLAEVTE